MRYARLVDDPYCARLTLTTAPAIEPVSVADLMAHSRIDNAAEGSYLAGLITASRQWIEQYLGRQLITATWTMKLDEFPAGDDLELPRPPLLTVASVKYYDVNRALQTVDASSYYVHTFAGPEAAPGMLERIQGFAWPTAYDGDGAVEIAFTAGYGATANLVPLQIRQAIMIHAAELYERREQLAGGAFGGALIPSAITVERLLWPLRVW